MSQTAWDVGFFVWIIQAFVFGLLVARTLRRKARYLSLSGMLLVMLCVVWGPISWLLALAIPARPITHQMCPYCQFVIPLGARVCGHCGRDLVPLVARD